MVLINSHAIWPLSFQIIFLFPPLFLFLIPDTVSSADVVYGSVTCYLPQTGGNGGRLLPFSHGLSWLGLGVSDFLRWDADRWPLTLKAALQGHAFLWFLNFSCLVAWLVPKLPFCCVDILSRMGEPLVTAQASQYQEQITSAMSTFFLHMQPFPATSPPWPWLLWPKLRS